MARPREFDKEAVFHKALEEFWSNGYSSTSIHDLMAAMNLKKGSLYSSFGNKHSLFLATLKHYSNSLYTDFNKPFNNAPSAHEGMRAFLTEVFVMFVVDSQFKKGCFSINSIVELAPTDKEVKKFLQFHMNRIEKMLEVNLKKGQKSGQLRSDIDANQLAIIIKNIMTGLTVNSKIGGSRKKTKQLMESVFKLIEIT